ncbi:MAG: L-threonylcarbamoyladenylate synthase [Pseudomonadota bacterium]
MHTHQARKLEPNGDGIASAAALLRAGRLVAFPTETVYGLGAAAQDGAAVAAIYAAKGRPSFNPLIVHVADMAQAQSIAQFDDTALQLAQAFWPGPLTLVLPLAPGHGIASLVTAGLDTVALRVPGHPLAQALLQEFGGPVAAPSANPSGRISPTRAAHVLAGLGDQIDAVLDGGTCPVGLESTIVGGAPLALLRAGGVAVEEIEKITGPLVTAGPEITAPGQLAAHYAPAVPLRLNARVATVEEVLVGFGPGPGDLNLSATGNLTEAAANLFEMLHMLDARGQPAAIAPIPDHGLGRAINDRLRRAAVR